jgi:hypothetical protein
MYKCLLIGGPLDGYFFYQPRRKRTVLVAEVSYIYLGRIDTYYIYKISTMTSTNAWNKLVHGYIESASK